MKRKLEMFDIADKIIELRLLTRRVCTCENSEKGKNTMSLKTKILYLIDKAFSTKDIIACLGIAKTNLALITTSLANDGLITKTQKTRDKREKSYALTVKGMDYLDERKEVINNAFKNVLTDEEDFESAVEKFDEILKLLSFVG